MKRKIIFYELNEVPWKIFDHYAKSFPNSAFNKMKRCSALFETISEDSGHLSPWITWPTLHRGITNQDHEISDFGQDLRHVNKEFPAIWEILSARGLKVGMFGSLHTHPMPDNVSDYSFYVPDTFAAGPECFPKKLEDFQKFNLAMASKNASQVNNGIALREAINFLKSAPFLGLRARTARKLFSQLINEKIHKDRVVRRRTSQVQIAFDFFFRGLIRQKPDATFFFTNHVASSMHRYWPAIFPEDYDELSYDQQWLLKWSNEIPFTLHEANYQIGELLKFVERHKEYNLVVLTSMGQEAVQSSQPINTKVIIASLGKLMKSIGLDEGEWIQKPAMVPQYNVWVSSEKIKLFLQKIGAITINGRHLRVNELGSDIFKIEFGLVNHNELNVLFEGDQVEPARFGIVNLDLQDAAGANAYHIPEGMMIIHDPNNVKLQESKPNMISTLDIAPTILRNFGINAPRYMNDGFSI